MLSVVKGGQGWLTRVRQEGMWAGHRSGAEMQPIMILLAQRTRSTRKIGEDNNNSAFDCTV